MAKELLGKRRQELNGAESVQGPVYPLACCRCCEPRKIIFPCEDKQMRHTVVPLPHSPCWFLVKFKSSRGGASAEKKREWM